MRFSLFQKFLLLLCVLAFIGSDQILVDCQCLKEQNSLLLQLKQSFDQSSVMSWNSSTDCCSWKGVTCDGDAGHVIGLDLSSCGLYGKFPEKILQLTTLQTLDLSLNFLLHGSLPESMGNLSLLSKLKLNSCSFNGSIPFSIVNLTHLVYLDLSSNSFSGSIPPSIVNLTHLVYLDLSSNSFSGSIPPSIVNLIHLVHLDLSYNSFNGSTPFSIVNLTHLVYLDLSDNSFTGPIPLLPENLTEIYLSHNHLTGSLPFTNCEMLLKLMNLDLTNNALNGTIPSCLFTLPSLQRLELSNNQLAGQLLELSNVSLAPLYILELGSNKLEGPIPRSIFEFLGLEILSLSFNSFNGTVHLGMIQKLENLWNLDLSHNSLSINTSVSNSTLHFFPQMTSLRLASCKLRVFPDFLRITQQHMRYLDLSDNQIQGKIPTWIWRISYLAYLNLSCNFLVDLERPLPNLTNSELDILDLHSNLFQGPIPILAAIPSYLDYSRNNFNSIIPADIASNTSKILFFSLASNRLTGEIPPSICNATALQVLDLSNNSLSGLIPSCFSTTLRVLNLRQNNFSGTIPQKFSHQCRLRTLDLSVNRLEGQVSTTLTNCREIAILNLGNNQINGTFPVWLGKLSLLRILILRSNRFYGSIKDMGTNYTFPMLQVIDLSSNDFTGNLPSATFLSWKSMTVDGDDTLKELKDELSMLNSIPMPSEVFIQAYYQDSVTLTNKRAKMELSKILRIFTCIDFSNNKFQGEIPEVIGNLAWLHVLNLSNNALTGHIPSSMGNMTQLQSLDLSQNKLTGKIPLQLSSLTFLSSLNLSWNKLEGMIPTGGQFSTFQKDSFEGNAGLCGPPMSRNCTENEAPVPNSSFEHAGSKSVFGFDLQFALSGLVTGFGLGAGTIIAYFLFSKRGRKWLLARSR